LPVFVVSTILPLESIIIKLISGITLPSATFSRAIICSGYVTIPVPSVL